jgi:hypothetical protein
MSGWSDKAIEKRKRTGILKPPVQKVRVPSARDEALEEFRFQEQAVLAQLDLLRAAREKLAEIDGKKLHEPNDLHRLVVRIAQAVNRALFRRVMTQVQENETREGWIESAEVRNVLMSADSFAVFDDGELAAFLDKCWTQPTLAELRERGVRMGEMGEEWDTHHLAALVEGDPKNESVRAYATCEAPVR